MEIDRLTDSLLNGRLLHCQPVENGPIIEARVIPIGDDSTPAFKKAIVCPARRACSECELRIRAGSENKHCQYYKGDSRGLYQIIGPDMDKKLDTGI